MPKEVTMYPQEEVTAHVFNILDELKSFQEEAVKEWVKNTYPDPSEIYE